MKAWIPLEGLFLWFVVLLIVISQTHELLGISWPASPSNGFGRRLAYPTISLLHLLLAAVLLSLMLVSNRQVKLLSAFWEIVACLTGFYSTWWPGILVTTFPLTVGGASLAIGAITSTVTQNTNN